MQSVLALAFGVLVAVSVGAVIFLLVSANFANTFSLLNTRSIELIHSLEKEINREAAQVESTLNAARDISAQPEYATAELAALVRVAGPVEQLFVVRQDGSFVSAARNADGKVVPTVAGFNPWTFMAPETKERIAQSAQPVWLDVMKMGDTAYQAVALRTSPEAETSGSIIALFGQDAVNSTMQQLGSTVDATVFFVDGDGLVFGHSRMPDAFDGRKAIPIAEFPDPAVRQWPLAAADNQFEAAARAGVDVRSDENGKGGFVYITKQLTGFSSKPYTLGVIMAKSTVGEEIMRALGSMLVGLAGLGLAVVAAIFVGRRVARPMHAIARNAALFSDFQLEQISALPRSRISEIDELSLAFNRLHAAMQQFARYVPRELVRRIVRADHGIPSTVEREVTILFTDIVGFTSLSERLSALETAQLLNRHFTMLSQKVSQTGGVVDKYIGDGMMAFWGAPESDPLQVANALETMSAIAAEATAINAELRARGENPLRIRMGLHVGRVIVGNIGAEDRLNYTIVGDAVNVANRLEELGAQEMSPEDDVIAMVSGTIVERNGGKFAFKPAGTRVIRGREKPIQVCRFLPAGVAGSNVVPISAADRGA